MRQHNEMFQAEVEERLIPIDDVLEAPALTFISFLKPEGQKDGVLLRMVADGREYLFAMAQSEVENIAAVASEAVAYLTASRH